MDFANYWYVDGFDAGMRPLANPTDNVINDVYSMQQISHEKLIQMNGWYPGTMTVYDPRTGKIPLYSIFVKYPKDEKNNGGYLSINFGQLEETIAQAKKREIEIELFQGILKRRGGKKRSSSTRTIRKTRKRNFRGRRRTNRRHRRNVKK